MFHCFGPNQITILHATKNAHKSHDHPFSKSHSTAAIIDRSKGALHSRSSRPLQMEPQRLLKQESSTYQYNQDFTYSIVTAKNQKVICQKLNGLSKTKHVHGIKRLKRARVLKRTCYKACDLHLSLQKLNQAKCYS